MPPPFFLDSRLLCFPFTTPRSSARLPTRTPRDGDGGGAARRRSVRGSKTWPTPSPPRSRASGHRRASEETFGVAGRGSMSFGGCASAAHRLRSGSLVDPRQSKADWCGVFIRKFVDRGVCQGHLLILLQSLRHIKNHKTGTQ